MLSAKWRSFFPGGDELHMVDLNHTFTIGPWATIHFPWDTQNFVNASGVNKLMYGKRFADESTYSCNQMYVFELKFLLSCSLTVQYTVSQNWPRYWRVTYHKPYDVTWPHWVISDKNQSESVFCQWRWHLGFYGPLLYQVAPPTSQYRFFARGTHDNRLKCDIYIDKVAWIFF